MSNESEDTSLSREANEIDTFSGQYERCGERRPALVFLRGELLAVPIPLERKEVTLGRALDADVRINDARASRLHARITTERDEATGETRYSLTDLDSTNGTMLNGRPVTRAFLADGDKCEVGARFGGEEFAAFLLDADYAQGLVAAERVRSSTEKHEFSAVRRGSEEEPRTHHITISLGVASFPDDARDPMQLVEMADSALYQAKRSGRNRVCPYRLNAFSGDPLARLKSRQE